MSNVVRIFAPPSPLVWSLFEICEKTSSPLGSRELWSLATAGSYQQRRRVTCRLARFALRQTAGVVGRTKMH
ncbi:hypothetical protein AGABI2DRAFT_196208 [Agaricus bisporus var. bisporus H97]|uniref:hypothetical protein n=1 Tax=Agaricus bisporus var. bisporus (strain H97 / ATCC MYA-4626 / FGSC 10389) TaxID=936046 RepID=UPI00029F71AD|nr:hypothetical protein AGABI2DRAFT_196208 [Agaricus bisporus var. bisporus H97]EKV41712.1 hypothetical protein AGABI2DRAFT_196208 [Agaricus bisporus var. bisporus H97]